MGQWAADGPKMSQHTVENHGHYKSLLLKHTIEVTHQRELWRWQVVHCLEKPNALLLLYNGHI